MMRKQLIGFAAAIGLTWACAPAWAQQITGAYAGHGLIGVQTFCASGCTHTSGSTYIPDAGTVQVIVEVQAAGGGSGGCAATGAGAYCISGPGNGGSYAKYLITSGFSGVTVTVGAAGAAGAAGNNAAGAGSASSFGSFVSCPAGPSGGGGPSTSFASAGAAGATGTAAAACTLSGGVTIASIAGGISGVGEALGSTAFTLITPAGGSSQMGRGGPALTGASTSAGLAGTGYGSGASSAVLAASQSAVGGTAGQPGIVIVEEFN
jgi:hypothetical protein